MNFLELLLENHRMPVIFRIRREFESHWEEYNKRLPVLDRLRRRARRGHRARHRRPDRRADGPQGRALLEVEPDIIGGIVVRVGNQVLDASIRNRLDTLRKQVVRA